MLAHPVDYAKIQTSLLAAAGEHYVMSRLLRRGLIAALAPRGAPNADILVSTETGDRLCAAQVKTRSGRGGHGGWPMNAKHEKLASPTLFYVFVDYGDQKVEGRPTCYILPSATVAAVLKIDHQRWVDTLGKEGQLHGPTALRIFLKDYDRPGQKPIGYPRGWLDKYCESWDLLQVVPGEQCRVRTSAVLTDSPPGLVAEGQSLDTQGPRNEPPTPLDPATERKPETTT